MKGPESYLGDPGGSAALPIGDIPVPCVLCVQGSSSKAFANQAFVDLIGEGPDWNADWWLDSADPESREILLPLATGETDSFQQGSIVTLRRRDGEFIEVPMRVSFSGQGVLMCFGQPKSVVGPDGQGLQKTQADELADILPIGLMKIDIPLGGKVVMCNKALCELLSLDCKSVMGRGYATAFSSKAFSSLRDMISSAIDSFQRGKVGVFEKLNKGGGRRSFSVSSSWIETGGDAHSSVIFIISDVTELYLHQEERKRINSALQCREENYRILAENSSDLITRHGFEGIIIFASSAAERMLGVEAESLLGHGLEEYAHEEDKSRLHKFFLQLDGGGGPSSVTCRMISRTKGEIWVETLATAVKGRNGVADLTCVSRDVTERKLAEDRMRELQNHLSDAIENMDAGIVMYDSDERLVLSNRVYRNFYPSIANLIYPGAFYDDILDAFISQGVSINSGMNAEEIKEFRKCNHFERNGEKHLRLLGNRWVQVSDHPTLDGGVVTLMTDVTELKTARDELARQELMLSSLLDTIPDLISYKDASGVYLSCNPAFCRVTGLSKEQIVGFDDATLFGAEIADVVAADDAVAIRERRAYRSEEWLTYPDGSRVRLETIRMPMLSTEGEVLGLVGVGRDVTARHVAETDLKAESVRLSALIENLDGGVLLMDQEMHVIFGNEGFLNLFRISGDPESITGADCNGLMDRARHSFLNPDESCRRFISIFDAAKPVREAVLALRDETFIEYDFIPVELDEGIFNFLWHFRDISSRYRAEIELQRRDTLLSGLARTVRELLAGLEDFDASIMEAFRTIAETANIERILILENKIEVEDGRERKIAHYRYRWSRMLGAAKERVEFARIPFDPDFLRWESELSRGVILAGCIDDFPKSEQTLLKENGFGSILVAPMFIEGRFWGVMLFDAIPDREWSSSDRGVLRMVSDSIGMAIQRKQAHDQLNSALADAERLAQEAREANQAKTDFLASMSHEIRTPLNGIVGYSNLLRNTKITSRQADLLRGVERSTDILLALINDILDLSKISAGQLSLDRMPFCPAIAAEDAIEALKSRAAEKNLAVNSRYDDDFRTLFVGDERRLKQVLLNLVGNAIKFTERGSVDVIGSVSHDGPDENGNYRLEFTVADTGIGISAENQGKLFMPFSQAQSDISRRFGGTGLGLAICKQLVGNMGGDIWLESEPGVGSKFHFSILCPLAEIEEGGFSSGSDEPEPAQRCVEPLNILIADDNVINQEVLGMYIEEMGYAPRIVASGTEAVKAVCEGNFDLVLMDLRMPGMDGIEATQAIRAWEKEHLPAGRKPTRIVALTADAVKSDSERCIAMGMDEYVTKPVDPDRISRIIRQFFS